jgi:hypothetical protein
LTFEDYGILIRSVIQKTLLPSLLLLTLPLHAQTAPANDSFNNRINIGAQASYTVSTSNIDATVQGGESTLNGLLGATIWWQWTCPSTGWARIDTQGSAIDTVLRVNSSQGQGGNLFGYNDDSDPQTFTSTLTFLATANTIYYLQIGGYRGEQGNIQLNVATGSHLAPSHLPEGLVYTPSSINVTSSAAAVSAEISVGGTSGISGRMDLRFLRPNETEVAPNFSGSFEYTSGVTAANLSTVIPQYSQSGSWHPLVTLTPTAGPVLRFGGTNSGRPYLLSTTMLPPLGVTNSGTSDVEAPALTAFSVSTTAVDVSQESTTITISATVTDALSGVDLVQVWLYHPFNPALNLLLPVALSAGTVNNGTWSTQAVIPRQYPSETYAVNIILRDQALNQALYGANSTLETPGGDVFMTIQGGGAYWRWAYEKIWPNSPLVDLGSDANGDGISNLLCYAFGIDPIAPVPIGAMPLVTRNDATPSSLTISFRRNLSPDSGVTYHPEFSGNLTQWQPSTLDPEIISLTGSWQELKVTDHENATSSPRRCGRVRVVYAEP